MNYQERVNCYCRLIHSFYFKSLSFFRIIYFFLVFKDNLKTSVFEEILPYHYDGSYLFIQFL